METQDIVKEWEQRLRQEGEKKGREDGEKDGEKKGEKKGLQTAADTIRPVLLRLYSFRFGEVPEQVRKRIETESDLTVIAAWTELIAREPQEIVDRALTGAQT